MKSENVCRICLCSFNHLVSLYTDFELINKLTACASIEIDVNDSLPSTICVNCFTRLNDAYEFRELVRNSDLFLRTNTIYTNYSEYRTPSIDPHTLGNSQLTSVSDVCEVYIKNETSDANAEENLGCNSPESSNRSSSSDNYLLIENNHSKKKPTCQKLKSKKITNQRIVTSSTLNEYNQENLNSKETIKALCSTCGKTFTKTDGFQNHLISHSTERRHVCDTCGKKFKKKSHLKNHFITHVSSVNYPCKICGSVFKYISGLNRHLRIHTGVKNYKCSFCDKGFTQKNFLEKHLRVHSGEQPFKCEYCNRGFSQRWNLDQHTRLHTNVKPYKCSQCDCAFRHNVTLKSHVKSKHSSVVQ